MNNNQNSLPIIPFKPQGGNNNNQPAATTVNQEELIAKAEDIIAPKKSKTKIILTTLVAFLLLSSVAGAVFLVRQNQDIRKQAADCTAPPGKIGNDGGGGCCGSYVSTDGSSCDSGDCSSSEECRISNGACASGTSCGAKECKANGLSCSDNWECCSGGCTDGSCQGGAPITQPRPPSQVCAEEGGSTTTNCTADPNCPQNGGVCCNISTKNYCCYGDSQTRKDGACYLGGQQTDVTCNGSTITNNTASPITLNRFTGIGSCPFSSPAGTKQLGAGQSMTASCEQLDATGKCGVCNDTNCGGPQATPTLPPSTTPTPTMAISYQCQQLKAYNTSWTQLTSADLTALKPGDKVRFAATATATSGTIDKMRFKINNGAFSESVTKKPGTSEYYYEYTIPANTASFSVSAEAHHKESNKWF